MPLIDRAWKANINVWKRHITLKSVFNYGECMMHANKNAECHVVDQNVDRILREIAYEPLGRRIRSKRSSCMLFFFFFLNECKRGLPEVKKIWRFWSCVSEDQRFWILAHVFRGPRIFWALAHVFKGPRISGLWLMYSENQRILAHVLKGPMVLDLGLCFQNQGFLGLGSCFQRTKSSGSWLMFLED